MDEDPTRDSRSFDRIEVEDLVELYSNMIYRLALSRLGNREDAEDITQEVFMRYVQAEPELYSEEHRKAWLLRVTMNCCANARNSAYNRHHATLTDELAAITADPNADIPEEDQAIALIQQLPPRYRQAIHLYYYEELSVAQIAQLMDSREGTIKSLLHRGRNRLRRLMEDIYEK